MTGSRPADGSTGATELHDFVPELRAGFGRRDCGGEAVVWSPLAPEPTVLDPVTTVLLDVVDGSVSVAELAVEVHQEIGVPLETAQRQVARAVERFAEVGLLTASTGNDTAAEDAIAAREPFVGNSTPCSENASRLGTEAINLRIGERTVRIACDSRRAARALRAALLDHLVDTTDDVPLAFVLSAPQGLKRTHELTDRSGFVLSEGRGIDRGLHALASHLTALLPPRPGTVRFRARAIAAGDRTVLCVSPLLSVPAVPERDLGRAGLALVDRLALDVDIETGRITHPEVPWASLARLEAGPVHLGTGGARAVHAVVVALPDSGSLTPGGAVARLAASGVHGSAEDLLDVAARLVEGAELRSTLPGTEPFLEALNRLCATGS